MTKADIKAKLTLIEAAKKALELLGDGFTRSGGTDTTSWDECVECGAPDWKGHKPKCEMAATITAIREAIDEKESEAKNDTCTICDGTGVVEIDWCPICEGTGIDGGDPVVWREKLRGKAKAVAS